jgi:RHS repeat-associated protein
MAWVHTNVWAAGRLLATYAQDSSSTTQKGLIHFYFNDPLGSRRAQTDYAGNLEQNCGNLPYGDGETCGPTPTEHLFTNKERDAETGNDYFGARYYASTMGRFLSPDWSAKVEPVPYSKLDDPQTLNLYAYVLNNPVARGDIDGHVPLSWGGFEDCGARNDCNGGGQTDDAVAANKAAQAAQSAADRQSSKGSGFWGKVGHFFSGLGHGIGNLFSHGSWNYDKATTRTVQDDSNLTVHPDTGSYKTFYQITGSYTYASGSLSYVPSTGNLIADAGPGLGDGGAAVVGLSKDPEGYLKGWSGTVCGFGGGGGCYGQSPGGAPTFMGGLGFGGWGGSVTYGKTVESGPVNDYQPGTVKMGDAYFDDEAGMWQQ